MSEYKIRVAEKIDIPFLAKAVIESEKGITDKCNYSTLFNLAESKVLEYVIAMFEEEIDGCEFSLSSYFVAEFKGKTVASFGGWIERSEGELPSKILKSNLINYTFATESINFLKTKSEMLRELIVERTPETLQFEYLYVIKEHRGKNLPSLLIKKIEEAALEKKSNLQIAEFQLFSNNLVIVKLFEKHGYKVVQSVRTSDLDILNYLPSNEKLVMKKSFN